MYEHDDLLPLSGLQHLVFCERQCALIHVERMWEDNALTAQGGLLHNRVDRGGGEKRPGVRTVRSVPLRSLRLGLVGKADVVEFHEQTAGVPESQTVPGRKIGFPGDEGEKRWRPMPVEYKRGAPKRGLADEVQLCAQATCLEEMLGASIPMGSLFYGKIRRRVDVPLTTGLRDATATAATRFHEMVRSGHVPRARREPKCRSCSLLDLCMPQRRSRRDPRAYLESAING